MSQLRSIAVIWVSLISSVWAIGLGVKLGVLAFESVLPMVDYMDALFSVLVGSILLSIFLRRWKDFRFNR